MNTDITAPMAATVVEVAVAPGQAVARGALLVVVEAMKMEHEIRAEADASVAAVLAAAGEVVEAGDLLLRLAAPPALPTEPGDAEEVAAVAGELRPDLQELQTRLAATLDAARPDAVVRRHATGARTARENVEALCDPGSFVEYGALAIAAQRSRRALDDLIANTPADGLICGIGSVAGARCVVLAYDATVLAGTQGVRNHQKTDRLLGLALAQQLPVVLFAEGGGGRPGDTDMPIVAGLHVTTFASFAKLSGRVPLVGIVHGRCFAGNAALLGCCDVIVATQASNIGMGGPAMVEGGGLGRVAPEQIGPSDVQSANGVIDVLVADEAEAVAVARRTLGCFQGRTTDWSAADPQALREVLPQNRVRSYDMRAVMTLVADSGSLLELRTGFGVGIHTAFVRIEGRPVGLLANNPMFLGGAIDADAADKAARFMRLCDAHGLPLVSLIDTPGFMVGPEVEATAQVRHVARMFLAAAHLRVPYLALVLRKGYGLGAMAMAAGGFHAPLATAAWPSGEFGAMGLEGAVKLGFRKELEALPEGAAREQRYRALVDAHYERGKAINMAATLEIDAVIDPAQTRAWLAAGLASAQVGERRPGPVDSW